MPALPYGLTTYGFIMKPLAQILAEIEAAEVDGIRTADGVEALNVRTGPIAIVNGIMASKLRELWELIGAVASGQDRDNAQGALLEAIGALTGETKKDATKSAALLTLTLGAGVLVRAGSIASVLGVPQARFVTLADVLSVGAGAYTVLAAAETAGPIAALAGTITVIETPVSGWASVTNAADAVQGRLVETDPQFRTRSDAELASLGSTLVDAIRADLALALPNAVTITVNHNTSDVVDANGLPPHSIEAVVYDGTDTGTIISANAIAQALWRNGPAAGIQTYGSSSGTAVDSLGVTHIVPFSRPTPRPIYLSVSVNVATARGWDPVAGPPAIQAAIVAAGRADCGTGDDVARFRVALAPVFAVQGVLDVTVCTLGLAPAPVGTLNIAIGVRELATFDTSRVVVAPTVVNPP